MTRVDTRAAIVQIAGLLQGFFAICMNSWYSFWRKDGRWLAIEPEIPRERRELSI
jgi:hypothetical protein